MLLALSFVRKRTWKPTTWKGAINDGPSFKKPKTIIVPGINSPFEAEIAVTAGLYALDDDDVKLGYCRGGNPFVRSGLFSNVNTV